MVEFYHLQLLYPNRVKLNEESIVIGLKVQHLKIGGNRNVDLDHRL
jgi:hypothetical protein